MRPMVAKISEACPACGEKIVAGKTKVLMRFTRQDWVHARSRCLNAE